MCHSQRSDDGIHASCGSIANIRLRDADFLKLVHQDLPVWLKNSIQQQTQHAQRTPLSVAKVQELMIVQHFVNDLGFLFNFYTENDGDQKFLHQLVKVREDPSINISIDYLLSLSESDVAYLEPAPKRIIITISESADKEPGDEGYVRDINLYGNMGADTDVIEDAFKQVLVRFCGLGETTIESMLPVNYDKVKISKDPATGGIRWEYAGASTSSDQATNQPSAQDADVEPIDADIEEVDETDPVDETDAVNGQLSSMNLNDMDDAANDQLSSMNLNDLD